VRDAKDTEGGHNHGSYGTGSRVIREVGGEKRVFLGVIAPRPRGTTRMIIRSGRLLFQVLEGLGGRDERKVVKVADPVGVNEGMTACCQVVGLRIFWVIKARIVQNKWGGRGG